MAEVFRDIMLVFVIMTMLCGFIGIFLLFDNSNWFRESGLRRKRAASVESIALTKDSKFNSNDRSLHRKLAKSFNYWEISRGFLLNVVSKEEKESKTYIFDHTHVDTSRYARKNIWFHGVFIQFNQRCLPNFHLTKSSFLHLLHPSGYPQVKRDGSLSWISPGLSLHAHPQRTNQTIELLLENEKLFNFIYLSNFHFVLFNASSVVVYLKGRLPESKDAYQDLERDIVERLQAIYRNTAEKVDPAQEIKWLKQNVDKG